MFNFKLRAFPTDESRNAFLPSNPGPAAVGRRDRDGRSGLEGQSSLHTRMKFNAPVLTIAVGLLKRCPPN
jgi:hypothetical protein